MDQSAKGELSEEALKRIAGWPEEMYEELHMEGVVDAKDEPLLDMLAADEHLSPHLASVLLVEALVASRVMGFEWRTKSRLGAGTKDNRLLLSEDDGSGLWEGSEKASGEDPFFDWGRSVPKYMRSAEAAEAVASKVGISVIRSADGIYALKPRDIVHVSLEKFEAQSIEVHGREGQVLRPYTSAPKAICYAALSHQAALSREAENA